MHNINILGMGLMVSWFGFWFSFFLFYFGICTLVFCCDFLYVCFSCPFLCTPVFHLFIGPCVFKSVFFSLSLSVHPFCFSLVPWSWSLSCCLCPQVIMVCTWFSYLLTDHSCFAFVTYSFGLGFMDSSFSVLKCFFLCVFSASLLPLCLHLGSSPLFAKPWRHQKDNQNRYLVWLSNRCFSLVTEGKTQMYQ